MEPKRTSNGFIQRLRTNKSEDFLFPGPVVDISLMTVLFEFLVGAKAAINILEPH